MTIKELADLAGVSHSTVSRSLNDSPLISETTKGRIKELAREHDFVFNANARGLSTKRTGTVGIIFPAESIRGEAPGYLEHLLRSLRRSLEREDYDSLIAYTGPRRERENPIRRLLRQKKVDGLILALPRVAEEEAAFLEASGVPFITIHFRQAAPLWNRGDFIYTDHFRGGYLATTQLLAAGRRRLITLTEQQALPEFRERSRGFLAGLGDYGVSPKAAVIGGEAGFDFGYRYITENRKQLGKIDGLFAQTDMTALGAMEGLKEAGIQIPEDIAVVGYDDIEIGRYLRPRLTTVHQPREESADRACRQLLSRIKARDGEVPALQLLLEPALIIRESCGTASA